MKSLFRTFEKAAMSPTEQYQLSAIVDIARQGIVCDDFKGMHGTLQRLLESPQTRVLRMKNRFAFPSPGGWSDILLNLQFVDDPFHHVWEVQLMHSKLFLCRDELGGHKDYVKLRAAAEVIELHGVLSGASVPSALP